jgi:4'-phosphopantetheinyl transferase
MTLVHVAVRHTTALRGIEPAPVDAEAAEGLPAWRAAEYLAARTLLRRLLADVGEPGATTLPIAARDTGQPHLPDRPDLAISLSHEGGWVAAGIGTTDIGVDVQLPSPTNLGLIRRCCTPSAQRELTDLPDAQRDLEFARIWTVQEACVKAAGSGLGGRPWTVPVEVGQRTGVWHGYRWHRLSDRLGVPASCAYREEAA